MLVIKHNLAVNTFITQNGGINGINIDFANDPYGSTPGQDGSNLFNLKIPVDTVLFKPNIDSVRIKDSATSCAGFNFRGLGYTNTSAINSWKWYFGDGGTDVQPKYVAHLFYCRYVHCKTGGNKYKWM
jgi:hypothetical protein